MSELGRKRRIASLKKRLRGKRKAALEKQIKRLKSPK